MAMSAAAALTSVSSRLSGRRPTLMPEKLELIEAERYEMSAPPSYRFDVDRRDFIGLLGGGLLVVFSARAQESGRGGRRSDGPPQELDAWLHIGEDGIVSVCTGKTEVGQNVR